MAKDIVFEIIPNEISKETVYFRLKDTILDNETIFHERLMVSSLRFRTLFSISQSLATFPRVGVPVQG